MQTEERSSSRGALARLVEGILPRICLGCHAPAAPELSLCCRCRAALQPLRGRRCETCASPLPPHTVRTRCSACERRPPPIDRLCAVWTYAHPLDRVIHGLKFRRLEPLAEDLARAAFDRYGELLGACDLVVPVPISPWRRLRRGFNQAERIASAVARRLDLDLIGALRRSQTRPHSLLDRRRRLALSPNAIRATRSLGAARVALVDDVVTTGATLHACARALRDAGAAEIVALAIAWTPPARPAPDAP